MRILLRLKSSKIRQAGLSLVEIITAIAITGLIGLGAAVASIQVLNQNARNSDYTLASREALNALYWMSHDASMAQSLNGTAGFPQTENLSLYWIGWDNTTYSTNYTLENGVLKRVYSKNGQVTTSIIASYINPDPLLTFCSLDAGILTVTITSSVGAGDRVVNVTKVREITPRPSL